MEVYCIHCRRLISRQFLANHQAGPRCKADTTARILLAPPHNLMPYPMENNLPKCIPTVAHVTRARHEGQRLNENGAVIPRSSRFYLQLWVPAWVDVIVEAWMLLDRAHKNRRDRVLCALLKQPQATLHALFSQVQGMEAVALAESLALHSAPGDA